MIESDMNIYCVRPDNTAIWLPFRVLKAIGVELRTLPLPDCAGVSFHGEQMTREQFESGEVQDVIRERKRIEDEKNKRKRSHNDNA